VVIWVFCSDNNGVNTAGESIRTIEVKDLQSMALLLHKERETSPRSRRMSSFRAQLKNWGRFLSSSTLSRRILSYFSTAFLNFPIGSVGGQSHRQQIRIRSSRKPWEIIKGIQFYCFCCDPTWYFSLQIHNITLYQALGWGLFKFRWKFTKSLDGEWLSKGWYYARHFYS